MMVTPTPVGEADLHAYADGQLSGPRRAEVEAFLAADPEAARKVEAWRRQTAGLHASLNAVLKEAVPLDALPRGLRAGSGRTKAHRPLWPVALALAGSVATFIIGGTSGWMARGRFDADLGGVPPLERFARDALASHVVYAPEVRHVVEVPASDEAHMVAWLSKRLGAPLQVPDLRAQGFRLIGGRLGVAEGGPMAILMYENDAGTRLSLQLRRMAQGTPDTAFRLERLAPAQGAQSTGPAAMAFYWVDHNLGFALAGPIDRERLLALATAVYQQYQRG